MITTWFTADQHFCHRNILKHATRPFSRVEDMDTKLIEQWNSVVRKNDHIYCLGDFALHHRTANVASIFDQLQGVKHLIRGNHDDKHVFRLPWASQADYAEIKLDQRHIVLFHFAIVQWARWRYGAFHLHGHHHGTLPAIRNRIDVGVDCWNLTPVSWPQISNTETA